MRIGFDAKRAFYNQSGLGNYSRSTIELLTKFHPTHDYFLFSPKLKNNIFKNRPKNTKAITPSGFIDSNLSSMWRTFRMARDIKKSNIDLFHGLSNELPQNLHKKNVKSIVTIHDLIFIRYPELYKPADRAIYHQKFKHAAQIADKVIAISEQTKSDIINFLNIDESKISVVYQGCNPIFHQDPGNKQKIEVAGKYNLPQEYMLNIGTVEKRKNTLAVVKALKENKIDIPFIIIGRQTDYQNEIEDYIKRNNMESQVKIFNNVPFTDFPAIYRQASLFIYPSIFEGFGIPIIEALHSNIPVITTRGGCFSEAGGFSARYTDPNDTDEIAEAITDILSDEKVRGRMTHDGKNYVQKFSEERISQNLMNIYHQL
ncbi:MAG: glycosyltransferase family 1 protein [Bacteroidota bacterium]|nr:glycosyltransferase family 1 protein [Bacteroidota bacterium]